MAGGLVGRAGGWAGDRARNCSIGGVNDPATEPPAGRPLRRLSRPCRRPSSTSISTARSGSRPRSSWPARAGSTPRATGRAWRPRSSPRCRAPTRPSCSAPSTCRSRSCRMPRRSNGSRPSSSRPRPPTASATSRSAGARSSTWPAGCRSPTGSRPCARAPARGEARTGTVVRLICTALRSHEPAANVTLAETAARFRDEGLTGWDLAGPEAAFPDPLVHARAFEAARAGGLRITLHAGEWGGAAQVARALAARPRADRARPGRRRRPGPVRRAHRAGRDARPVPDLQLAGRHRAVAGRPSPRPPPPGRRPGHAQHGRHHGQRPVAVRRVRPGGRDDRADVPELWAIDRHALEVAFADEAVLAPLRTAFASAASAAATAGPLT